MPEPQQATTRPEHIIAVPNAIYMEALPEIELEPEPMPEPTPAPMYLLI
jgi:hypothetical protein